MFHHISRLALFSVLALAVVACQPPAMTRASSDAGPQTMPVHSTAEAPMLEAFKGIELYSWQEDGEWHYSLMSGTNRLKTAEEIRRATPDHWGSPTRIKGLDALSREFARVPKGAELMWTGGADWPLPPEPVRAQVKTMAEQAGAKVVGF
jgi:hypothetical protein